MKTTRHQTLWALCLGLIVLASPQVASAQARGGPGFLERMKKALLEHKPSRFEKAHVSVKHAFREVVKEARNSTVAIYDGDKQIALGTIVDADGYIVTKATELRGDLQVKLASGAMHKAEQVKSDAANDMALIKIDADNLPVIEWREGDAPALGSFLVTANVDANPVAIGVVSVAARKIRKERGLLGVRLEDAEAGALIEEIVKKSAAETAGLKKGDIVTAVNGEETKNREKMIRIVGAMAPGDKVKLKVTRGEEEMDVEAVLGSMSLSGDRASRFAKMNSLGGPLSKRRMGFENALQHDTYLAPKDCGGPICDLDGKAIGINIARAGRVNSYALPASVVKTLLADLAVVKLERAKAAAQVSDEDSPKDAQ